MGFSSEIPPFPQVFHPEVLSGASALELHEDPTQILSAKKGVRKTPCFSRLKKGGDPSLKWGKFFPSGWFLGDTGRQKPSFSVGIFLMVRVL